MRKQDLPILLIASAALWVAGDTVLLDGTRHNTIDRSSGIMLIVIFIFYLWFMIISGDKASDADEDTISSSTVADPTAVEHGVAGAHSFKAEVRVLNGKISALRAKQWFSWLMIAGGLAALVVGGNWVVDGASGLALKVGMSQAMVALTVVAIGNALPDLVTSVTATVKGASGIAFGNIVGSCIINALLTIGLSSLVIPLDGDSIGFVDFFTVVMASALLWIVPSLTKKRNIGRVFGVILILLYIAYMVFTVIRG